jgi:adhesin/invasin
MMLSVCCGFLTCTIKDDNGGLVGPGGNNNNQPVTPITPQTKPGMLISMDSSYLMPGDTLAFYVRIFKDSALTDTAAGLSRALVTAIATIGSMRSDSQLTDTNGRAVFYFTDSVDRKNVQIMFACNGVTQIRRFDVTGQPEIEKNLTIMSDRPSIRADGKDYTTITVRVIDPDNVPIAGQCVQFMTTTGVIIGAGDAACGNKISQSKTDGEGIAQAKLVSTNRNDTAFVTAFLVSNQSLSGETQVAFQGVTIRLSADSTNLRLSAKTTITATLVNASDVAIANSRIYFTIGKGAASNISFDSGTVDNSTGFDGTARATITGKAIGTDSITVAAAGTVAHLKINVTDLNLKATVFPEIIQARQGRTSTLAVEFAQNDGTVLNGKTVRLIRHYTDPAGAPLSDTLTGATGADGKCNLTIAALPYENTIRLEVTAYRSSTEMATAETVLQCITTRTMTMYALPSVILADGSSTSAITVQVMNEDRNPMVGDIITFASDIGMITGEATTDVNGRAVAILTSDRRNAIASVTATLKKDPTKQQKITVEFAGVEMNAAAAPQSINSSGSDTSLVTVTLVDAMKNPIVGEAVNYCSSCKQAATKIIIVDTATNNRGEAHFKVAGTGTGTDTLVFEAAGARAKTVIYYSSNHLTIDTSSADMSTPNSYFANGIDMTRLVITYYKGNNDTIPNNPLQVSITLGSLPKPNDTIFARPCTTGAMGRCTLYVKNPDFADSATINVKAISSTEITSASIKVYYRATIVTQLKLSGTPAVISSNGDRCKLTVVATDAMGNRVSDAMISFNLANGPGGGEFLDPPTMTTGIDGTASTNLISGPLPSNFREVWIVASTFNRVFSDTVRMTIAGPPKYITIRRDIGKLARNPNGTYTNKICAIVTDINGNPVSDGTEVTFSLRVTGYKIYFEKYKFVPTYISSQPWEMVRDTANDTKFLPFEDQNDNFTNDPGEDLDMDGWANRGEDVDGLGYHPSQAFEDLNKNGRRDMVPVEDTCTWCGPGIFNDVNGNGIRDPYEMLKDTMPNQATAEANWRAGIGFNANIGTYLDYDQCKNGVPEPQTAATIKRTVQTVAGIANNEITYGQSDAWHVQVEISAESKGLVTQSTEKFMLDILMEDVMYFDRIPCQ